MIQQKQTAMKYKVEIFFSDFSSRIVTVRTSSTVPAESERELDALVMANFQNVDDYTFQPLK